MDNINKYLKQKEWMKKNAAKVTQDHKDNHNLLYDEMIMQEIEKAVITDDLRKPYYDYINKKRL